MQASGGHQVLGAPLLARPLSPHGTHGTHDHG